MRNRQEERQAAIRSKGFSMNRTGDRVDYGPENPINYGTIKVGTKTLTDATLELGGLKKAHSRFGNKGIVLKAIAERNLPLLREISNYFYNTSGIYQRVCDYFAYLYRYDWYIVPEMYDESEKSKEKVLAEFNKLLGFLDNSHIKKVCGDIALNVIKNGAYYGYIVKSSDCIILQELPVNYCRVRYYVGNMPVVEFNMSFFDEKFPDPVYRMRVLKMFPEEFAKGYRLYKTGKLSGEHEGVDTCENQANHCPDHDHSDLRNWYPLEPGSAIKFCFSNGDQPLFISAVPNILDLDAAQDLDRRKQMQQLLKILIQKLPRDKNGDLIFDVDEARDIHNNAVEMLRHAIGVDVLTTFADVQVEDIADSNSQTDDDALDRTERTVYNSLGVSRNLFNTDGNLSLEKSILDDESTMRTLLLQFHIFFDLVTQKTGANKKKYNFRFYMLETTQYNYKEMSKMYKEQVQIGYSKMLPQIALGHSQSAIIHTAYFENEVLHLSEIMIPPLMSSTMNADALLGKNDKTSGSNSQKTTEDNAGGRPEKSNEEKSDKTIQNLESKS